MSDHPISTASRMICSLFSSSETKMPSWPSRSARRMNCVANVVLPAPDAPITTVVECSLNPPSKRGLRPKIPVRILRTRAHEEVRIKTLVSGFSDGGSRRQHAREERVEFVGGETPAEPTVLPCDEGAAAEVREGGNDLHAVCVPERIALVVEPHDREPTVRLRRAGVERRPEAAAERAPLCPEHDDGWIRRAEDLPVERLRIRDLELRHCTSHPLPSI